MNMGRRTTTDLTRMRIFALGLVLGAAAGFIAAAVAAVGAVGHG